MPVPFSTYLAVGPVENTLSQQIPHVYRLAVRLCRDRSLADDLTQETMVKAIQKFDQLQSADRLRVWLFQILANTWRDHLRKNARRRTEPLGQEPVRGEQPVSQNLESQEELRTVLDTMDSLPEKQRAVLHLFAVEQLSLNEIAEILGMNPSTARVNLFHARQSMKRKLPQFADPKSTAIRPLH